tara:strand:- start:3306 stop:3686 length:381 start_codon:yes stop_codon:yes gene_type:complete
MRLVLSLAIAMLSMGVLAQDTIPIPQVELDGIIEAIDTLVEQDSINSLIILSLESEIKLFETILKQDSLVLAYKQEQIVLLENQIQLYDDRLNQVDKWYDKRPFGVVVGVLGTIGLIHVIGYTLPE